MPQPLRHLLTIRELGTDRLRALLTRARSALGDERAESDPAHQARLITTLFLEDSTRTRLSFTRAAQRLGAATLDLAAGSSSVSKGESVVDTAQTVEAMGADVLIVRSRQAGGAGLVARHVGAAVVNAGDGRHAHPTQALADMLAINRARIGGEGFDLSGVRVGIVGDIANSRVARSAIEAVTLLGGQTVAIGPPAMAPARLRSLGCTVTSNLDSTIGELDVIMMLRVQRERHGGAALDTAAYARGYQLNEARLEQLKPNAAILHPGPVNRGIEMESAAIDDPRCRMLDQVRCGVAARVAVLSAMLSAAR